MAFQFRDLVLFMESTPRTERTRLRLQDINELTVPINLAEGELACPGRTSGGLISLDSLDDLTNALADLEAQLQQAIRSAQGEGTK
jgi:hypothetical protein